MNCSQMFWNAGNNLGLNKEWVDEISSTSPTARSACVPFTVAIEDFNAADLSAVSVDPHLPIKARHRLQAHQTEVLQKQFSTNPNPTPAVRAELAQHLNMREREVQVWFQNRRAKIKREQAAPAPKKPKKAPRRPKHKTPPSVPEPAFCSDPTGLNLEFTPQPNLLSMGYPTGTFPWEWSFPDSNFQQPQPQVSDFYWNYPLMATPSMVPNLDYSLGFISPTNNFPSAIMSPAAEFPIMTAGPHFDMFNSSVPL